MATPTVIDSAAASVIADRLENLGRLVMVAILAVTPDSVWMLEHYDGFNAADVILVTLTQSGRQSVPNAVSNDCRRRFGHALKGFFHSLAETFGSGPQPQSRRIGAGLRTKNRPDAFL
jgi:hypothetical protein